MKYLRTGNFFGETNRILRLGGVTLTDTEYTHRYVDWHHHENAYFTFILEGALTEGSRRRIFEVANGGLLFHHADEPHFNEKPDQYTRGFHVEMSDEFLSESFPQESLAEGSFEISDPFVKLLFYRIFRQSRIFDDVAAAAIEIDLIAALSTISRTNTRLNRRHSRWPRILREFLNDAHSESVSLARLAEVADIHPVHLSRDFHKHFGCGLAEYVRRLRVEKSLALLPDRSLSLTEIGFLCGFADQSHFTRVFREHMAVTPSQYRSLFI